MEKNKFESLKMLEIDKNQTEKFLAFMCTQFNEHPKQSVKYLTNFIFPINQLGKWPRLTRYCTLFKVILSDTDKI